MFSKLALRNVRRSFRDYGVYLLTLTFGVCLENLPPEGRNDPARPEGRLKDSISCWFRRNRAGHQVPSPVLSGVSGNHVFFCPY